MTKTGSHDPRAIPVLGDPAFMVPLGLVVAGLISLLFAWMLFPKRS